MKIRCWKGKIKEMYNRLNVPDIWEDVELQFHNCGSKYTYTELVRSRNYHICEISVSTPVHWLGRRSWWPWHEQQGHVKDRSDVPSGLQNGESSGITYSEGKSGVISSGHDGGSSGTGYGKCKSNKGQSSLHDGSVNSASCGKEQWQERQRFQLTFLRIFEF